MNEKNNIDINAVLDIYVKETLKNATSIDEMFNFAQKTYEKTGEVLSQVYDTFEQKMHKYGDKHRIENGHNPNNLFLIDLSAETSSGLIEIIKKNPRYYEKIQELDKLDKAKIDLNTKYKEDDVKMIELSEIRCYAKNESEHDSMGHKIPMENIYLNVSMKDKIKSYVTRTKINTILINELSNRLGTYKNEIKTEIKELKPQASIDTSFLDDL